MLNRSQPTRFEIQVAMIVTVVLLTGLLTTRAITGLASRNDFNPMYTAAWMVQNDGPARIYDLAEQSRVQQLLLPRPGGALFPFIHPPFEALFLSPLAALPYPAAYFVWGIINLSLWVWFVAAVRRFALIPKQPFQYLILCFAFFPMWIAFLQGSTSMLVLVSYFMTYSAMSKGRDFRAGAFLGLGLLRFQLVLPFAFISAMRGKWKVLAGLTTVALLLGIISYAFIGPGGATGYILLITGIAARSTDPIQASIPYTSMITLRGFFAGLIGDGISAKWISIISASASLLLITSIGWYWRRDDKRGGNQLERLFAAALITSIAGGFYSLVHDLSLGLLAILLVMNSCAFQRAKNRLLLASSILLLYTLPIVIILTSANSLYLMCPVLVAFVFGTLRLETPQRDGTASSQAV